MTLVRLLEAQREEILGAWRRRIVATYPPEASRSLSSEKGRFSNPVGSAITEGTAALLDALVRGAAADELIPLLDGIVRIRAVQDFAPSEAVGFVFLLKGAVQEVPGIREGQHGDELLAFFARIDELALLAFDLHMRCREQVHALRTRGTGV